MEVQVPDVPLIDVHTHVFNAAYVPVAGILIQRIGSPDWAARRLESIVKRRIPSGPIDCVAGFTAVIDLQTLSDDELLDHLTEELIGVDVDPAVEAALTFDADEAAQIGYEPLPEGFRVPGWLRGPFKSLLRWVANASENPRALLEWLGVLFAHECEIYSRLQVAIPDAVLYVHHMMDMAAYYEGEPEYDFVDVQIPRMLQLSEQSGGRLLTFVAFDPSRADAVALVDEALRDGCAGVKFYPPNGYRPLGNDAAADTRNRALFDLCERLGVPIFTHCTAGGFESQPGSGLLSDPMSWRQVMAEFPALRLCLGHAGGAGDWVSGEMLGSYARTVVSLCEYYPNVYCEVGHFEEILDPDARAVFAERLRAVLVSSDPAKPHSMADKLMFGSDWHVMAAGELDDEEYTAAFEAVFTDDLAELRGRFFGANALAYLDVSGYLARVGPVLSEAQRAYLGALG